MIKHILIFLFTAATFSVVSAQDFFKLTSGSIVTIGGGATLFVNGGIDADNNSTLVNNGKLVIAKSSAGSANFTDKTSTPYNYGSGEFVFTGTGLQTLNTPNLFNQILVDNTGLNLGSDLRASNWTLKAGIVNTGAFTAIANAATQTAITADGSNTGFTQSWINGNLRRNITPAAVNRYVFPVGSATKANVLEMDNLQVSPLTGVSFITASFGPKAGTDAGLAASDLATPYSSINSAGVWHLAPDVSPSAGKFDLKLYINGFAGLADNSFGILSRPESSSTGAGWLAPAGSTLAGAGSPGRTVAGGYAGRNAIAAFGQFGIASALTVLPLQLLKFTGIKKEQSVFLQWETDNETNTSHFEVFRAGEFIAANTIGSVAASGSTSSVKQYSFVDEHPLSGANYYQLKMIDRDGKFSLSKSVIVRFDNRSTLNIYPNPVIGNTLNISYDGGTIKNIKLITLDGKEVPCSFQSSGNNRFKVSLPGIYPAGSYALLISTPEGVITRMIVLQ